MLLILFKDWEQKLSVSGAVDWEGTTRQVAPPPLRQVKPPSIPPGSAVRIAQNGQVNMLSCISAASLKPGITLCAPEQALLHINVFCYTHLNDMRIHNNYSFLRVFELRFCSHRKKHAVSAKSPAFN